MKKQSIKQGMVKVLSFIEKNKKPILVGGTVLLGSFILYKVYQGVNNFIKPAGDNHIKGTGQGLIRKNLTITEAQAKNYAQQLLDAMNQNDCWLCYGTDEKAILSVFKKIKNRDDFLLIYNAFGRKDYNGYNSPPQGILRHLDSYKPRDLVYWLKSELSSDDGEVYRLVKKTVESAGFSF